MSTYDKLFDGLKPTVYNWRHDPDHKKSFGFIAQDLLQVFPADEYDVVVQDANGMYQVNYHQLIPLLVLRIRQLEERVAQLEERTDSDHK